MTVRDFLEMFEQPDAGCWEWLGYVDANGYGKGFDGSLADHRYGWAHRLSYRHFNGEIPQGHEIDHTCENTTCVNPDHLDAVTKVEHCRRTMERLGKDRQHAAAAYLRQMGMTYGEIAEAMGYSARTGAHLAVQAAIKKGLVSTDECPPARRLTEAERGDIQELSAWGFSNTAIAEMYEVDNSHISRLVNGRRSGHEKRAA